MNEYQKALNEMYAVLNDSERWHEKKSLLQELVDKETPMKPKYISLLTNPPKHKVVCSNFHGPYLERVFKFCPSCGQKIDWGYENDLETVKELVNKEKRE